MRDSRYVRGLILKALYAQHPEWTPDKLLLLTLSNLECAVSPERLSSELVYLRDWPEVGKGYIQLDIKAVPGSDDIIYSSRITPRGINLYEKLSPPDPTVMVGL